MFVPIGTGIGKIGRNASSRKRASFADVVQKDQFEFGDIVTSIDIRITWQIRSVVVTLPPHIYHKLKPVFGSFTNAYKRVMVEFVRDHPGRAVTIYDLQSLVTKGFVKIND